MIPRSGLLLLVTACLGVGFTASASALTGSSPNYSAVSAPALTVSAPADPASADPASALYDGLGLAELMERDVFAAAYESIASRGLDVGSGTLAIADMSQPSTSKRLVIVDLAQQKILLNTWVAHGQGSGGLIAKSFSNTHDSHQTSLGLYRVGQKIVSPKHGPALLLAGLDVGLNDQARAREVIIHGADYVSADFIKRTGRLGRSWGCPAVPRAEMARVITTLADGGLLYVHGG